MGTKWVSVTDKMPKGAQWVLVYDAELLLVWLAFYDGYGGFVINDGMKLKMITHWRKIPKPPENQ